MFEQEFLGRATPAIVESITFHEYVIATLEVLILNRVIFKRNCRLMLSELIM